MSRSQTARRVLAVATTETSMRILEYGVCVVAVSAAILLGLLR